MLKIHCQIGTEHFTTPYMYRCFDDELMLFAIVGDKGLVTLTIL